MANKWLKALRASYNDDPVYIPKDELDGITAADVPEGVVVGIGRTEWDTTMIQWEGVLVCRGGAFVAKRMYRYSKQYWNAPIGIEHFMDLVHRAAEARQRTAGDVKVLVYHDDGADIRLTYEIMTRMADADVAFAKASRIADAIKAAAWQAQDEIGRIIAEIAARLSGRDHDEAEALLRQVETATDTHQKGRSLEELMCRLFTQVPGFQVQGRMITANEEIDITVLNGSDDPRFRRDAPLVLVECKNWAGRTGRPDFSAFMTKIENRAGRSNFGVMVSWNGFAGTVREERLRHSRGGILVATMTGDDVRKAIRERNFPSALFAAWHAAVAI